MRRTLLAAALIILPATVLSGCSPFPSHHVATRTGPLPSPTPVTNTPTLTTPHSSGTTTAPASNVPVGPRVTGFGVNAGLVFVQVVNDSRRWIRAARVEITARDTQGDVIVSETDALGSRCCTVYSLPPHGVYGLFANLQGSRVPVASVQVRYLDPSLGGRHGPAASVAVLHPVLSVGDDDAVVRARLVMHGRAGPFVVGQAFLADRRGRLVGVISGRFYCFSPGVPRTVFMHLLHPVPRGTRIVRTVAYPVPPGQPTAAGYRCSS